MNSRIKQLRIREIMLLLTILLSGCEKKQPQKTLRPENRAIRVITDWSGISADAVQPKNYLLRIGALSQTVSETDNQFEHLFTEGTYPFLAYNTPIGITIDGTKGTVSTLPDGTLEPQPTYLFSAAEELNVINGNTALVVKAKMAQSIFTLRLVIKLKGGDPANIITTSATLSGVAHTIDLTTGKPDATGAGKSVRPIFQLGTITPTYSETIPALITTMRLAGVVKGESQRLTLTINLNNNSTQTIETDLTEMLQNFGHSVKPLELSATIELSKETILEATIGDWSVVNNGTIEVN